MDGYRLMISINAALKYKGCIIVGYSLLQDVEFNILLLFAHKS